MDLSLKLKNTLLIVIFLSICLFCDGFFFSNTILSIFPNFTCNFEHSLGYKLYQLNENYKILYNNRDIVTSIFGCVYFLFFRVYVFQKWITIIENKCQGLFLHDFLTELRKNKQILLYANVILFLISLVIYDFISDIFKINNILSFIFTIPFQYLILYIRWVIEDKNFKSEKNSTKEHHITRYINYLLLANFPLIAEAFFSAPNIVFLNIISIVLLLLAIYYILYCICYYIKQNIKQFMLFLTIISALICFLIYILSDDVNTVYLDWLINPILVLLYYLVYLIGLSSSFFINKISKLIINL